jgi:hypothetical protein
MFIDVRVRARCPSQRPSWRITELHVCICVFACWGDGMPGVNVCVCVRACVRVGDD